MKTSPENAFSVGKYLLSPLVRRTESGQFAASLSIRSGRGSGTHDRVFRYVPLFAGRDQAAHYAVSQGLSWLHQRSATV
jgi:hypothetical protein